MHKLHSKRAFIETFSATHARLERMALNEPRHTSSNANTRSHAGRSRQSGARTTTSGRTHASHAYQKRSSSGNKQRPTSRPIQKHSGAGQHRHTPIKRKRHLVLKWILGILLAGIVAAGSLFAYLYITTEIPQPESIALAQTTKVTYADGTTPIGTFANQNRQIISCKDLPDYVGNAIVASEDRSFWSNRGIDITGIARALYYNITTGSRQGGSTITQQYAERYYLGETTTYAGKAREAILALKIAGDQNKSEVLCNYMNTIYLGRGAYGIQAAARAYFGVDAKDLSVEQAALLAGIIPAPSTWDPAVNAKQAEARFKRVLRIMQEDGYITKKQQTSAQMPQTIEFSQSNAYEGPNGYLLQMVRDELIGTGAFTAEDLDTGGFTIVTTIDKAKQDLMYATVSPTQNGMAGIVPDTMEFGSMSVNARDGSIISLYAGEDYLTKQFNQATQSVYEIGSTMKPFALLGTIEQGVSLDTLFNGNSPRSFPGISDPVANFANQSYGNVNLYRATAFSLNTPYMDIQTKLTAKTIAEIAKKAGAESDSLDGTNPFTVLGNNALNVSDVARMYATLANQGKRPVLHIVASVKDSDGQELYQAPTNTEQVFDANDTALVTKALQGTVQYGTATEARAVGHNLAVKTGTANDSYAASAVGYTPSVVSVFAMWNPDENGNPQALSPFGAYSGGSDYPVHLFTQYMTQALADSQNEAFPTATDKGKVGGSDGSWGLGSRSFTNLQTAPEQPKQDAQDQSDESAANNQQETTENANGNSENGGTSQDQSDQSQQGGNSGSGDNQGTGTDTSGGSGTNAGSGGTGSSGAGGGN